MKLERSNQNSSKVKLKLESQAEIHRLIDTLSTAISMELTLIDDAPKTAEMLTVAIRIGSAQEVLEKVRKLEMAQKGSVTFPAYQLMAYFLITRGVQIDDINTTELRGLIDQILLS